MTADRGIPRGAHARPRGMKRTRRSLRMTLPTADRAPGLARQATRDALATWRLTPVEETVVLLVSELVIKAARRARGTFAVALSFGPSGPRLRIEARDADPRAEVVILDLELGGKKIIDEVPGLAAAGQPLAGFPGRPDPTVILVAPGAGACACATRNEGRGDRLAGTVLTVAETARTSRVRGRRPCSLTAVPARPCPPRSGKRCCCGSRACPRHQWPDGCRSPRTPSGSTSAGYG